MCCNGAIVAMAQMLHRRMCCIGASVAMAHWRMLSGKKSHATDGPPDFVKKFVYFKVGAR